MSCGTITKNILLEACGKATPSGSKSRVYIGNFDDLDQYASNPDYNTTADKGVIKELKLKGEAKLYKLISMPNATEGSVTFNNGTYFDTLDHAVTLRAFSKDQNTKDFANQLIKGARLFVIIENNASGNAQFELYGFDSGLVLNTVNYATTVTDGIVLEAALQSDENSKEGQLPYSVWDTDYATTVAMLDGKVGE